MSLKRRQFLLLSGFSAISAGFLGYKSHQIPKIASNPVIAANTNQKDLLLRFVSIADTGTGTRSQYAVAQAMTNYHRQNPYDLVVMAGDNIYPDGEIEKIAAVFERPYANLLKAGVKFQGALGNHDIRTSNGDRQLKYFGFNMKGRYYTFRRNQVQFFALDTNSNADWKNQLTWLENELSRSDARWKVVFAHHPIYASGVYGSNSIFSELPTLP